MKYSIIVPVYNGEKYILTCLESLIGQTFDDYEIIIINDGSIDNTETICKRYLSSGRKIKYIKKGNEGVVIARQVGVDNAQGHFLLFVDADDWVSKDLLVQIDCVQKKDDPDLICFETIEVNGDKKQNRNEYVKYPDKIDDNEIRKTIWPRLIQAPDGSYFSQSLWGKVFRTGSFKEILLRNSSINMGEDFACVAPYIYKSKTISFIRDCLYFYRRNDSSLTKNKTVFSWDAPQICAHHVERNIDMERIDFREQMYRRVCHELFSVCISRFNQSRSFSEIKREISLKLEEDYYKTAVNNCAFAGLKGVFMETVMKRRLFIPMYFYHKLKYR